MMAGSYENIIENQAAIDWLLSTFPDPQKGEQGHAEFTGTSILSDEEILNLAFDAKNGVKFRKVFCGDYSDYKSRSEADAGLASMVSFFTKDGEQIYRIMMASGLYHAKWDTLRNGKPYIRDVIEKFLNKETYWKNKKPEDAKEGEPAENEILQAIRDNEMGDARLLTAFCEGKYLFDASLGAWFNFKNPYWELDKIDSIYDIFDDKIIQAYRLQASREAFKRQEIAIKIGKGEIDLLEPESDENKKLKEKEKKHKALEGALLARIKSLQALDRRRRVVTLARTGAKSLATTGDNWDADPYLLACENGVIDLMTGELREGRPEDLLKLHSAIKPTFCV